MRLITQNDELSIIEHHDDLIAVLGDASITITQYPGWFTAWNPDLEIGGFIRALEPVSILETFLQYHGKDPEDYRDLLTPFAEEEEE